MIVSSCFLDACRGLPVAHVPVWFMRQAGRYQASYRAIRRKRAFFELCATPELAAQLTVNAVRELGVDAAIIFSDIFVPLMAMGVDVKMSDRGPVLPAIRNSSQAREFLRRPPGVEIPALDEAIKLTRAELSDSVPLIGFAAAPITLAAYLVSGGKSNDFAELKEFLRTEPVLARQLLRHLSALTTSHLRRQVLAGCRAVQIFDTWATTISPRQYREFAVPHLQEILEGLQDLEIPRILFARDTAPIFELLLGCGADVLSIDWTLDLGDARARMKGSPIQGNLDPRHLLLGEKELAAEIRSVIDKALFRQGHQGYIFNLGHGIRPATDIERVRFTVKTVHELTRAERSLA